LAVPSRATTITFNPGPGSTGPITGVSGFSYAPTSVLVSGINSPGTPGNPNTTPFQVYYESVINGTQGTNSTVGPNFNINGSTDQFTVIAGFTEHIVSFDSSGTLTFALNPTTGPNFFEILANPVGSGSNPVNGVNPSTGTGANFALGTPILTGTFIPANFGGSFSVSLQSNSTPTIASFNQSGLATTIPSTTTSLVGGGGTQLTVQVNSANATFFPTPPAELIFSTTNSLPFASVAPLTGFYNSSVSGIPAPTLVYATGGAPGTFDPGAVNAGGSTGANSLMFQSVATSSFASAVPEPSSIIPAVTAAMGIPLFLCFRRRGSKKTAA
jgi:hypothetical protein